MRELKHFGIPGQKWGIRRWQNADGSFNEEGKKRYGRVGGKRLRDLSDAEFAKRYNRIVGSLAGAGIATNVASSLVSFKSGKNADIIRLGSLATDAALLAISSRYLKELGKRTGTKAFTFNKEQNAKKEKFLKENGGMNKLQEKAYDKRTNTRDRYRKEFTKMTTSSPKSTGKERVEKWDAVKNEADKLFSKYPQLKRDFGSFNNIDDLEFFEYTLDEYGINADKYREALNEYDKLWR